MSTYWNVEQACVWIETRDERLVARVRTAAFGGLCQSTSGSVWGRRRNLRLAAVARRTRNAFTGPRAMSRNPDNPSTTFFWNDWDNEPGMKFCGLAAQGLWVKMLKPVPNKLKLRSILAGAKDGLQGVAAVQPAWDVVHRMIQMLGLVL
jgi:hypothetical protein